ncbi:hypothetical protein [Microbacterium lushaniae]|uniref:Uncharacterized protein n=1 Tax=Microbacterium lushaniae TaxID=2614639 RepID=A0A5J6L7Z4_9MICO|nr:hypothetical protein [Microbacterium lushaniae]QEW04603.1 hypothetical protein F6J85_16935 [Microbacterium lushaniae]
MPDETVSAAQLRETFERFALTGEGLGLRRPTLDESDVEADTRSFADYAAHTIERNALDVDLAGGSFGGFTTSRWASVLDILVRERPGVIEALRRCRTIGIPFDTSWSSNNSSMPLKSDGSITTMGPSDGSTSGALGVYLSAEQQMSVTFKPVGSYVYTSMSVGADQRGVRTAGGLGICAYQNGDLTLSRQVQLFQIRGEDLPYNPTAGLGTFFQGVHGEGDVADAASPPVPGTFGSVPLAPVYLTLGPDIRTQVWVYVWATGTAAEEMFTAMVVNLSAMQVCQVPPVKLH